VVDRRFAADIAIAAHEVLAATAIRRVIVVASPRMLGCLRRALLVGADRELETFALDLTRLTTPRLHDHLADLGVVPPRVRAAG